MPRYTSCMDFLTTIKWTPLNILKASAIGLGALLLFSILFSVVSSTFKSVSPHFSINEVPGGMMFEGDFSSARPSASPAFYAEEAGYDMAEMDSYGGGMVTLSARNAASSMLYPMPPMAPQGTTGDTAEDFEVTEYSASIETRNKDATCGSIADLKSRSYVVFESANEGDTSCNYSFKVRHENVEEVLAFVKTLEPTDLNENTYTIQNQVEDFTSETEILQKKLASVNETLESALDAYDGIQRLATQSQDESALARVIDSKIQLIERLSQERITINEQLDRYARAKSEQLDRLEYTYFHVSVYERKFVDGDQIRDSWKDSLAATIGDINRIIQESTLGLYALLFLALQWILYILILVVIAKYVWKAVIYIWYR